MRKEHTKKIPSVEEAVFMSRRRGIYKRLPRWLSNWLLRQKHKEEIKELELMEYGEAQELKSVDWKKISVVILWLLLLPIAVLIIFSIYKMPQLLVADYALKLTDNEWLQRVNEVRATLVQAIGGFILLIGLFFTWRNIRATEKNLKISQETTTKNLEIAQEGLVTQRFSKAMELLGSDKIDIRLGGIYALERIARESRKDHWPIMEILTAFVRENAAWKKGDIPKQIRTDVQAVLTVIGRRNKDHEYIGIRRSLSESRRLDLRGTNLQGADLFGANLAGANLTGVNLTKSKMLNTNLEYAILDDADLSESEIRASSLRDTNISGAQFRKARLFSVQFDKTVSVEPSNKESANFEGAYFWVCSLRNTKLLAAIFRDAKFYGGSLDGAHLKGADFTGATFDLVDLKDVDLTETMGIILEQVKKEGVTYEKSNLPAHIQEALSIKENLPKDVKNI